MRDARKVLIQVDDIYLIANAMSETTKSNGVDFDYVSLFRL